jgi:dihydrofolate synthase/folylpolyglutamate synthase
MNARITSYQQAIDWIFGLINFERKPGRSRDFRLDRTRTLLEACGDPHKDVPVVHIAGTKGKGSTATMTASILSEAGLVTGLFMSPHITRFEERLTVNGEEPTKSELVALVQELQEAVKACGGLMPTYFEAAMLLAWCFYRMRKADIAVLEVGLGGRLDATNVCCPEVCVITSISLDHTAVLGDTVQLIAAEKAGIMKHQIPVVSGVTTEPAQAVIEQHAAKQNAKLYQLGDDITFEYTPPAPGAVAGLVDVRTEDRQWPRLQVPFPGRHQAFNCAIAVGAVDILRKKGWEIPVEAVANGLAKTCLPARVEILGHNPLVVVDAAHNEESIAALVAAIDEISLARPRIAVFATTKQKDVEGMLRHLLPAFDHVVVTQYTKNPRAVPWETLLAQAHEANSESTELHSAGTPEEAWQKARSLVPAPALICTTGSFFIAAEIREIIL